MKSILELSLKFYILIFWDLGNLNFLDFWESIFFRLVCFTVFTEDVVSQCCTIIYINISSDFLTIVFHIALNIVIFIKCIIHRINTDATCPGLLKSSINERGHIFHLLLGLTHFLTSEVLKSATQWSKQRTVDLGCDLGTHCVQIAPTIISS